MIDMTLRGRNYATEIVTMGSIVDKLENLQLGDKYYFTVSTDWKTHVFYVEVIKEGENVVVMFCKDNTTFVNSFEEEDEVIKVAAITRGIAFSDELIIQDNAPTKALAKYVSNYIDAIQTIRI